MHGKVMSPADEIYFYTFSERFQRLSNNRTFQMTAVTTGLCQACVLVYGDCFYFEPVISQRK